MGRRITTCRHLPVESWQSAVLRPNECGSRTTSSMLYDHVFQPASSPFCSARRCSSPADDLGESALLGTGCSGGFEPAAIGEASRAHRTETPAVALLTTVPLGSDLA